MADPLTIGLGVLSGVNTAIGIATALYVRSSQSAAPQPSNRETLLGQPSHPSLLSGDTAAISGRVTALETKAEANAQQISALSSALDEERQGRGEIREMLAEMRGEARERRRGRAERRGGGDGRESQ